MPYSVQFVMLSLLYVVEYIKRYVFIVSELNIMTQLISEQIKC